MHVLSILLGCLITASSLTIDASSNDPSVEVTVSGPIGSVSGTTWELDAPAGSSVTKWPIEWRLDADAFAFAAEMECKLSFVIDGAFDADIDKDVYFGFGDGASFFSIIMGGDGGVATHGESIDVGTCPGQDAALAEGDVRALFDGPALTQREDVSSALCSGKDIDALSTTNDDSFPIYIDITNDAVNGRSTMKWRNGERSASQQFDSSFLTGADLYLTAVVDPEVDYVVFNSLTIGTLCAPSLTTIDASSSDPSVEVAVSDTQASVVDATHTWRLDTTQKPPVTEWGIEWILDADAFAFAPETECTLSLALNGVYTDLDADFYFSFGDGSSFFSVILGGAGNVATHSGNVALGSCADQDGSLFDGDVLAVFDGVSTTNRNEVSSAVCRANDIDVLSAIGDDSFPLYLDITNDAANGRAQLSWRNGGRSEAVLRQFESAFLTDAPLYLTVVLDPQGDYAELFDLTIGQQCATSPSPSPTAAPSASPISIPSASPSNAPSAAASPSDPTADPTADPTSDPTSDPTAGPTSYPTADPTVEPTNEPTADPTSDPTSDPTADPTADPTVNPTSDPTRDPSADPTVEPTNLPSVEPTAEPTREPTPSPTLDGCDLDIEAYLSECYCESTMPRFNLDSAQSNQEQQLDASLIREAMTGAGAASESGWQWELVIILMVVIIVQNAVLLVLKCYSLRAKPAPAKIAEARVEEDSVGMSVIPQSTATPSE